MTSVSFELWTFDTEWLWPVIDAGSPIGDWGTAPGRELNYGRMNMASTVSRKQTHGAM